MNRDTARGRVVVWGFLAGLPFPGTMWHRLQYLAGLKRLGFDVWYVEDSDRTLMHPVTLSKTLDYGPSVDYLARHMQAIGMQDRWVFRPPSRYDTCVGALSFEGLLRLYREADLVINHSAAQELLPHHSDIRRKMYLETDPVPLQVAAASGDRRSLDFLRAHDYLLTYASNLGKPDCRLPTAGFHWIPTRPAICMDWWFNKVRPRNPLTLRTVMTWQHSGKDVAWNGEAWRWSKHHEFLRFLDLPRRAALPLELAIAGVTQEQLAELHEHGWRTVAAADLATTEIYRNYIWGSAGEFTASKEQYVAPRSGWFSDRSASFLASGRPVVTQDTGFDCELPVGDGLFAFSDEGQALRAIDRIATDYAGQSEAARAVASEYFTAERVITRSFERIGLL